MPPPIAVVERDHATLRIIAVDRQGELLGLFPGQSLADARALHPTIDARAADRAADARFLARLARWATRYTPDAALDGEDGLLLDIGGSAALFGGESGLLLDLRRRFAATGLTARLAIAPTPLAAWAAARFLDPGTPEAATIIADGAHRATFDRLPPAALRLTAATLEQLNRLGLRRIGDLHGLARRGLAARFGDEIATRLDELCGRRDTPIAPLPPAPDWRTALAFAEPISTPEDIARVARRLIDQLCTKLAQAELGARRLVFECRRVDGRVERRGVATSAPARDPARLAKLLAEHLPTIDPGFGIEAASMAAPLVEPFVPAQCALTPAARHAADSFGPPAAIDLAPFVDQIVNRLGPDSIARVEIVARHVPELAQRPRPAAAVLTPAGDADAWRNPWTDGPTRPVRLLEHPEPVEVTASVPDGPPLLFRWRRIAHRVRHAEGPERIAPEWWLAFERARRDDAQAQGRPPPPLTRDYYRVEDEDGRRFWLFRDGLWTVETDLPRWYLHGLFA